MMNKKGLERSTHILEFTWKNWGKLDHLPNVGRDAFLAEI
jgi:hypothetical protein